MRKLLAAALLLFFAQVHAAPTTTTFLGTSNGTLDIGSDATNRYIVVTATDLRTGTNGSAELSGVTVDGKALNFYQSRQNSSGTMWTEVWIGDESEIGGSSGSVTISVTGEDSGWSFSATVFDGRAQALPSDSGTCDTNVGGLCSITGIDAPEDAYVFMGGGQNNGADTVAFTSPLTAAFADSVYTSVEYFAAYGVETSAQTNKTYSATWSGAGRRKSAILLVIDEVGITGPPAGYIEMLCTPGAPGNCDTDSILKNASITGYVAGDYFNLDVTSGGPLTYDGNGVISGPASAFPAAGNIELFDVSTDTAGSDVSFSLSEPANASPTITAIADFSVSEDIRSAPVSFTVADAETANGSLTVTGASSNTAVVASSGIVLTNNGAGSFDVEIDAVAGVSSGTSTITLTVSDGTTTTDEAFVVTVTAVNDEPEITRPGSQSVDSQVQTAITGISVTDIDAGTADVLTQLTVNGGVLNVTLASGASISAGANNSATMTITGTLTETNTTLATLQYTSNAAANDTLNIIVDDQGNTGGISLTDEENISINVAGSCNHGVIQSPISSPIQSPIRTPICQ